jgi:hypothetical protein
MTRSEYEDIGNFIYDNGRVITDENGDDAQSYETEFHFEAKQRGFSDVEIQLALNTYFERK